MRVKAWSATVQVLATHCVFKRGSNIVASPGTMLAPALLTDTEQQQQHILTPASAKAAPAQRHAHHCINCGAVQHTYIHAHAHTRAHTQMHNHTQSHTYTHTHAHSHTYTNTNARVNTDRRAHTYSCARTNTCVRTRTHAHRHTSACTHTRAHMHMHAHVVRVMGFANFCLSWWCIFKSLSPACLTYTGPTRSPLRWQAGGERAGPGW